MNFTQTILIAASFIFGIGCESTKNSNDLISIYLPKGYGEKRSSQPYADQFLKGLEGVTCDREVNLKIITRGAQIGEGNYHLHTIPKTSNPIGNVDPTKFEFIEPGSQIGSDV